jgi:hypothetical protein
MRLRHALVGLALVSPAMACSILQSWDGYGDGTSNGRTADASLDSLGSGDATGGADGLPVDARSGDTGDGDALAPVVLVASGGILGADGGDPLAPRDEVYAAELDVVDGGSAGWRLVGALPVALHSHAMIATSSALVVLGGSTTQNVASAGVWSVSVVDGGASSWSAQPSVPGARNRMVAVAARGYVYALGLEGTERAVSHATISDDGTVGAWNPTTPLLTARREHCAAASDTHVYVIAGEVTGTNVDVAPINGDGTLGPWQATTALPQPLEACSAVVVQGKLHVLGGFAGPSPVGVVRTADISPNGTLGSWMTGQAMTSPRAEHAFASTTTGSVSVFGAIGGFSAQGTCTASGEWMYARPNGTLAPWLPLPSFPAPVRRAAFAAFTR